MKKLAVIILVLLLHITGLSAGNRDFTRFTFGVESSYVLTFLNYSHFNYISAEGDRRDERPVTFTAASNGQFLAHCGVNISKKFNLSLYTGYAGIYRGDRLIPLAVRLSWYSGRDPMKNRWIAFCSAGTGFKTLKGPNRFSALGKIGAGYRISLNRAVKLDFLISFQETYSHLNAYESDAGNYVPAERLRRNDSYISAFSLGIGLTF